MPGLGMRDAKRGGKTIVARMNDPAKFPDKQRPVDCVCSGCGIPVEFRSGYEFPAGRTPPAWVHAVFRLKRHTAHRAGCPYDVQRTLMAEAARAENAANASGERLLSELAEHGYVIRLKMLGDAYGLTPAPPGATGPGPKRARQAYQHNRQRLAPYTVLIAGLVKLYASLRDRFEDGDLEDILRIEYRGKRIPWMQFLYEEQRRPDLVTAPFWNDLRATRPFAAFVTPVRRRAWAAGGVRLDTRAEVVAGISYDIGLFSRRADAFKHVSLRQRHLVFAGRSWLYGIGSPSLGIEVVEPSAIALAP